MAKVNKLEVLNDRLDPKVDSFLARIAAGRCSACWVIGYGLACVVFGAWLAW